MSGALSRAVTESMPPDDGVRVGIVASVSPLVITLQGAPVTLAGQLGVSVSVGDNVALLRQDQSWLVMGAILNKDAPADRNIVSLVDSSVVASTTTTVLTDLPGVAVTIARQRRDSRMRFAVTQAARQGGGAAQQALYAVLVTHADTGAFWLPTMQPGVKYDTASVTVHSGIERTLTPDPDLGTGSLVCQLQWRCLLAGPGLVQTSAPDTWAITVEEV